MLLGDPTPDDEDPAGPEPSRGPTGGGLAVAIRPGTARRARVAGAVKIVVVRLGQSGS